MSLISASAGNRPGHACFPWPKYRQSIPVVTNWFLFSWPGCCRRPSNQKPSNSNGFSQSVTSLAMLPVGHPMLYSFGRTTPSGKVRLFVTRRSNVNKPRRFILWDSFIKLSSLRSLATPFFVHTPFGEHRQTFGGITTMSPYAVLDRRYDFKLCISLGKVLFIFNSRAYFGICILQDFWTLKHCGILNHSEERLQIKTHPGSDFWRWRNLRSRSRWQWQQRRKVLQCQVSGKFPNTYCLAVLIRYFSTNAKKREEIVTSTGFKVLFMCSNVGRYNCNGIKLDPSCRYCSHSEDTVCNYNARKSGYRIEQRLFTNRNIRLVNTCFINSPR